jgi:hypothetical protein
MLHQVPSPFKSKHVGIIIEQKPEVLISRVSLYRCCGRRRLVQRAQLQQMHAVTVLGTLQRCRSSRCVQQQSLRSNGTVGTLIFVKAQC